MLFLLIKRALNITKQPFRLFSTKTLMEEDYSDPSLKPAATVIVVRPNHNIKFEGESDFEILMVKRKKSARFFAGAHVFPGGILEKSDSDNRWRKMIKEVENEDKEPIIGKDKELSFKIGAIREVFEETNVCISDKKKEVSHEKLQEYREKVVKNGDLFLEMCITLGLTPRPQDIHPWAHWITPKEEKYRYNTLFFVTLLDSFSQALDDKSGEVTSFDWLSPQKALSMFDNKKIYLPPPTWYILRDLSFYKTSNKLINTAKQRKFNSQSIPLVFPKIFSGEDAVTISDQSIKDQIGLDKTILTTIVMPGDELHPHSNSVGKKGLRNRIYSTSNTQVKNVEDIQYQYILQENFLNNSKL